MLFYSFFKSLVGKDIVVELKNDLNIAGTLHSVDQFLNFKLTDITVLDTQVRLALVAGANGHRTNVTLFFSFLTLLSPTDVVS